MKVNAIGNLVLARPAMPGGEAGRGAVQVEATAALAPMAGFCDTAFRTVCKSFGAAYVVGEMTSAKGLLYEGEKSRALLRVTEAERPMAVQLFGNDPDTVARAARLALAYEPEVIDLNMGCPTPKITGNGCGSALLKSPALAGSVIRAAALAVPVPVTVKIRLGWDTESVNCVEMARIAEQNGAAAVTLHARTRAQMYAPRADWSWIAKVKRAVSIPVLGNGDVASASDALRMYDETGCDLVMIGRGALGCPWLFAQVAAARKGLPVPPDPAPELRMQILRRHIVLLVENKGERTGMREARGHLAHYTRGLRGGAALRRTACALSRLDELDGWIEQALARNA